MNLNLKEAINYISSIYSGEDFWGKYFPDPLSKEYFNKNIVAMNFKIVTRTNYFRRFGVICLLWKEKNEIKHKELWNGYNSFGEHESGIYINNPENIQMEVEKGGAIKIKFSFTPSIVSPFYRKDYPKKKMLHIHIIP